MKRFFTQCLATCLAGAIAVFSSCKKDENKLVGV